MTPSIQKIQDTIDEITAQGAFFEIGSVESCGETYAAFTLAPKTVIEVLQNARAHGDKEFIVYEGRRYSYAQFFDEVDAFANGLLALGIKPGDRLAIAMRNSPEWVVAFAAATLVGTVVVPINSWGKTEELLYALNDASASVLVGDPQRLALIEGEATNVPRILVGDESDLAKNAANTPTPVLYRDIVEEHRGKALEPHSPSEYDPCMILYTSGSTGFPKGVVHMHIGVCQSLFNMMYLGMLVGSLEGFREFKGGATVETPLLTVPLFHATGLLSGFYLPIYTGQKVVMMYKWQGDKALELIQEERVTSFSSVPAIVQDLLSNPKYDDYDTASLIRVNGGGAALPEGLAELIEEKCGEVSRSSGYGMTESMAVCSTMSGCLFDIDPYSAGIKSPIMQVRTADADGKVLPDGETGEIQMRGVTCTPGYWEKPEANKDNFLDGHWMKTGDVGRLESSGFLYISGRIKEIVIRGGENIFPGEVENVAYSIDAVHECVVFGEPDHAMGEELVLAVYLRPGESLTEEALRKALSDRLASYKVPKTILFYDEPFPRNASEKIHKLAVKEQYLTAAS